jgi:hypothetical protein
MKGRVRKQVTAYLKLILRQCLELKVSNKLRHQPEQSVLRSIFEKDLPNNMSEASPFEVTSSSSLGLIEHT